MFWAMELFHVIARGIIGKLLFLALYRIKNSVPQYFVTIFVLWMVEKKELSGSFIFFFFQKYST